MDVINCACGCGETLEELDQRGRERKFIYGHGNRGRKFPSLKHSKQFPKGHKPWNKGVHVENAGTFKKGHEGLIGNESPTWKGGRGITTQGYVSINIGKNKRVLEHRYIMEQHLGRKLEVREHVHHINYDKTDNRIENLEVLDRTDHGSESANRRWHHLDKLD